MGASEHLQRSSEIGWEGAGGIDGYGICYVFVQTQYNSDESSGRVQTGLGRSVVTDKVPRRQWVWRKQVKSSGIVGVGV